MNFVNNTFPWDLLYHCTTRDHIFWMKKARSTKEKQFSVLLSWWRFLKATQVGPNIAKRLTHTWKRQQMMKETNEIYSANTNDQKATFGTSMVSAVVTSSSSFSPTPCPRKINLTWCASFSCEISKLQEDIFHMQKNLRTVLKILEPPDNLKFHKRASNGYKVMVVKVSK